MFVLLMLNPTPMNTLAHCKRLFFIPVLAILMAAGNASQAQGRVIINEFMAWPGQACPVTAEFIELKNMGPGPIDIGCYVITDGDFSITIPPNTILQPGKYYVLGGQNTIDAPCANINSNITVNLNWTTCGCTNKPVPTTDDGLMTDGGTASEQLVLFNPAGIIIDAVVRKLEGIEPSDTITTSSNGFCTPFTFDLDNLIINYEEIGESQGRGNSFARKIDGDCIWVKETQQNGGASNNAAGETATLSMSMTTTLNLNCITGNAVFTVNNPSPSTYFPMSYIFGYDSNGDGKFTSGDIYNTGTDNTSPSVEFNNLSLGSYNILIEPVSGCNYQFFTFELGPCTTLDLKLKNFSGYNQGKTNRFNIEIETDNDLKALYLESSVDGRNFIRQQPIPFEQKNGLQILQFSNDVNNAHFFRLVMIAANGKTQFSKVINITSTAEMNTFKVSPNPFSDYIGLSEYSSREDILIVNIVSTSGQILATEKFNLRIGENNYKMMTTRIPKGLYMVQTRKQLSGDTQTARIIKN